MKKTHKNKYLLIENDQEGLTQFISYLTQHHKDFKNENVVIDIMDHKNLDLEELLGFLELSSVHRLENKSFVIANDVFGVDKIPEELIVVPSLQEAEDMVEMDEIQRDLGF